MFQGGGIEKVFILNSPWVKEIKVISRAKVKRAKLYYIRSRTGKSARLKRKI
jgi:large subunit ribosomal protein L19